MRFAVVGGLFFLTSCGFAAESVKNVENAISKLVNGKRSSDVDATSPKTTRQSKSPVDQHDQHGAEEHALKDQPLRIWTNRTGERHAEAQLIEVVGGRARLRRSDGVVVSTPLGHLSQADQSYILAALGAPEPAEPKTVAAFRPEAANAAADGDVSSDPASGDTGALIQSFVESQFAGSTLMKALGRSGVDRILALWTGGKDEPTPINVVYARVSQPFLNRYVHRPVERTHPVSDWILDAYVTGQSTAHGATDLVLIPDKRRAVAEVHLRSDVAFNTVASHAPVHIHSTGVTHIEGGKPITFDGRNFALGTAWATGSTNSVTTGIDSDLWLFRRASLRIAASRVAANKAESDAIVAQRTAWRCRQQLDRDATAALSQLKERIARQVAATPSDPELGELSLRCCTTSDAIMFAMLAAPTAEQNHPRVTNVSTPGAGAPTENGAAGPRPQFADPPAWSGENNDVEVFVHRALVTKFVRDKKFRRSLEIFAGYWTNGPDRKTSSTAKGGARLVMTNSEKQQGGVEWLREVKLSSDGNWYRLAWNAAAPAPSAATPSESTSSASDQQSRRMSGCACR